MTKLDNIHVHKEINQTEIKLNKNIFENYITNLVNFIKG